MKNLQKIIKMHLQIVRNPSIMAVYSKLEEQALGELIAVLSGKGGTGKTSICAGVATALAELGERVVCIDCDIGLRNLDISLGLSEVGALSFLDVSQGGYSLSKATRHPAFANLQFLTAPIQCAPEKIDQVAFGRMLAMACEQADYVLLDAPAGIDLGFRMAARYAGRILLVTGPDPAAVRDAGRAGELLERMGKENIRLIVNRVDKKMVSAMNLTVDDVMDRTGLPLLGLVPEDSNVTLAAAYSKPLLYQTRRGAAAACRRIAKRIQGKVVPVSL